jgi:hypothetical protein
VAEVRGPLGSLSGRPSSADLFLQNVFIFLLHCNLSFAYIRVSQPGFRGTIGFREMSLGVSREAYLDKVKKIE